MLSWSTVTFSSSNRMPGKVDGLALVRIVQNRWPKLRLLLTTGFAGSVHDAIVGDLQGGGVLNKPYRKAELARALRTALARSPEAGGE